MLMSWVSPNLASSRPALPVPGAEVLMLMKPICPLTSVPT